MPTSYDLSGNFGIMRATLVAFSVERGFGGDCIKVPMLSKGAMQNTSLIHNK